MGLFLISKALYVIWGMYLTSRLIMRIKSELNKKYQKLLPVLGSSLNRK
jgi:hypothetical protein